MAESSLISRQRIKTLSGKLASSPFFPAFAVTRLSETLFPPNPLVWVAVFVLSTLVFVAGHRLLDSLNAQMDKLDNEQTLLNDYNG